MSRKENKSVKDLRKHIKTSESIIERELETENDDNVELILTKAKMVGCSAIQ